MEMRLMLEPIIDGWLPLAKVPDAGKDCEFSTFFSSASSSAPFSFLS